MRRGSHRFRKIAFRCGAVLFGLSILLCLEGVLALCGWGRVPLDEDPFIGFSAWTPLFTLDSTGERYVTSPARRSHFQPDSFSARKSDREYRVFCLGGSTVQGRPYAHETAFTTWLRLNLTAADAKREWKVINCGGVSYASYRLAPLLDEVLNYAPDLVIIYTGHNEFLEARTYQDAKGTAALAPAHYVLSQSRLYNLMRSAWQQRTETNKPKLGSEVDAILDYENGLEAYVRDDAGKSAVIQHFEFNLRRMAHAANVAHVPVLLVNPASNLRTTPPFKSEHRADISQAEITEFHEVWEQAKEQQDHDVAAALLLLDRVLDIDDRYAAAHFHRAKCLDLLGRREEAIRAYLLAKEEDICPLRILAPMQDAVRRVARQTGQSLVDLDLLFREVSSDHLPGDDLFVDHVHPTFGGHQRIAESIYREMVKQEILAANPSLETERKRIYADHFQSLPISYFERGKQRLVGLRRWTQGRAKKQVGKTE